MHRYLLPLCLLVPVPLLARDGKPEDIVRQAVDAAGGTDTLTKYPAGRITAKGTLFAGGAEVPVTVEQVYHVPGRSRTLVRMEAKGIKQEVLHVVNGAKVRYAINGTPIPTTDASAKELQSAALLLEVGQLTPLLTDRRYTLRPDRAAKDGVGVLVVTKGYPDVRLGFDRKTGHLVRVTRKVTDPDTGKESEQEQVMSEFKAFGGVTRPTRTVLSKDGVKVLELTTEAFTPLEKVDAKEFLTEQ